VIYNAEQLLFHDSFSSNLQQKIENNFFVVLATSSTLISFRFLSSEDNQKGKKGKNKVHRFLIYQKVFKKGKNKMQFLNLSESEK